MIGSLPAAHAAYLTRLVAELEADERFEALLAAGSLAQGGFDEQSDLNMVLIVRPECYAAAMDGRAALAARLGGLLAAFTGEHVGEPRLLICLYGPPLLHVDLKFELAADLNQRVERPLLLWARDRADIEARLAAAAIRWPDQSADWFEARAWIWLHYAATKLQRGELFEAIGMLGFFREQVLGPLLHRRAQRSQRGVRRIERLDPAGAAGLADTLAEFSGRSVAKALSAAVALYLELRADQPPVAPVPGMPELLLPLLAEPG